MGIQLTRHQQDAVDNRGGSLLVSAAAGSGKTKVLVERLFGYLTAAENPADVTDFLIITYTKAAAAELRMKIAAELAERLADAPENMHLQKQTMLIYRADIRTVDSFCTAILRENVHQIGAQDDPYALTPDFRVLDEREADLLQRQLLERVLESFYDAMQPGDGMELLASTIGAGRDDRNLEELVLQISKKIQSHAYPTRWLDTQTAFWENLPPQIDQTVYGRELLDSAAELAKYWSGIFSNLCREMEADEQMREKYLPAFSLAGESMNAFAAACKRSWDEAAETDVVFDKLKAVRGENELKERAKALWDRCKKDCAKSKEIFGASGETLCAELKTMAPAMLALLQLTKNFLSAYATEKLRRNLTDFSDQEHFALQILTGEDGTPTETGKTVSARFREIMIDEFQDTNEVQNQIFRAVSREGKNLFMVGDMKQSIYRFRLADPTIFLRHYQADPFYTDAEEGQERKLMLSQNFRSRSEVLEATNFVFSNILSRAMGEMDYTKSEQLNCGAKYYPAKDDCRCEFDLVDYQKPEDNEEKEAVRRSEAEARFVACRIRKLLDEGYLVLGDDGAMHPVREEDIVILMRSPGPRRALYEQALAEQGVTCAAEGSEDFFSAMEVAVTFAFLQVIDNPRQDVPLISVLRSPLFSFSPDRLAEIRGKTRQGDFYTALCADEKSDSQEFLRELERLRNLAPDLSVHRLLWHIYNRWNVLGVFGAMPDGERRRERLLALYEHAKAFESAGWRGLFPFVCHLRQMLETGEEIAAPSHTESRGVRLMSIHKSKGLEFPVVILADLEKGFNRTDSTAAVLMHPELGLGPVFVDLARRIRYPSAAKEAVLRRQEREQKAEEMRVLYVGMTRAKEKLIMVASAKNAASMLKKLAAVADCPAQPEAVAGCGSMAQWILLPLLCRTEAYALRQAAGMNAQNTDNTGAPWEVNLVAGAEYCTAQEYGIPLPEGTAVAESFDPEQIAYRYPYLSETRMPSKLTATQLKGRLVDERVAEEAAVPPLQSTFRAPRFLEGARKLTAAEKGTATHLVLQFIDFAAADGEQGVRREVARMTAQRLLTQQQAECIRVEQIAAFLDTPVGRELRAAPQEQVHREYRFSVLRKAADYDAALTSDDEVLLQGAVDCFFQTEDGLTVLDFKTDHVRPGQEAQRAEEYRPQMTAYCQVLERIFRLPVTRRILCFFATGTQWNMEKEEKQQK